MRDTSKVRTRRHLIMGGLVLLISLSSLGLVQAATTLTTEEKYWLTHMREEEKLARDVYISLYKKWGLTIFANISTSEQTHMDAVKTLLDRYGLPDPAANNGEGVFTDPALQELYNELIAQGFISEVEALSAGVTIEETDIADLNEAIASTKRKDIKTVYSNLLQGSLNHLKAFVSELAEYGVTFQP